MPVRHLDHGVALIVVDFQEGTRRFVGAAGPQVYATASRLATAFRDHGKPVILTKMEGSAGGRSDVAPDGSVYAFPPEAQAFVPELGQQSSDVVISKRRWGAFFATGLQQMLEELQVTQVVICGTAASIGVESTAREAYALGLNVTMALDAICDFNPEALRNSVERIFPILGETGTVAEIVGVLGRDCAGEN